MLISKAKQPGMVAHAFSPSTYEAEVYIAISRPIKAYREPVLKERGEVCRDTSEVKSTKCFSIGPRFSSQYMAAHNCLYITSVLSEI